MNKNSYTDGDIGKFLKKEGIDIKNKKYFFKCFQKRNKNFPNLWNKVSNFDFLLSLYRENKKLKEVNKK